MLHSIWGDVLAALQHLLSTSWSNPARKPRIVPSLLGVLRGLALTCSQLPSLAASVAASVLDCLPLLEHAVLQLLAASPEGQLLHQLGAALLALLQALLGAVEEEEQEWGPELTLAVMEAAKRIMAALQVDFL